MKKSLLLAFALASTTYVFAQGPSLFLDINPGTASASPTNLALLGTNFLFSANDGTNGSELWISDGTSGNTVMLKDIYPGTTGSSPTGLIVCNGVLYFSANDGTNGIELWKSDGTANGTVMVKDINAGSGNANTQWGFGFKNINNILYFTANDGTNGLELWKSDGTASGTAMVADINPGSAGSSQWGISLNDALLNGYFFFSADDGVNGAELWKSDGTTSGTSFVKDIRPNASGSSPSGFIVYNGALYFSANDGTNGIEMWTSDGTAGGTTLFKDINPGSTGSSVYSFKNINGQLLFSANDGTNGAELWSSDGTINGTIMLKDINSGSASSNPSNIWDFNGQMIFSADDGVNGGELWLSDGTANGTVMVADINPGASGAGIDNPRLNNGYIYFDANDGVNGWELWRTDGTGAGTLLVANIYPGSGSSWPGTSFIDLNGYSYFTANDSTDGTEIWRMSTIVSVPSQVSNDKITVFPNPFSYAATVFIANENPDHTLNFHIDIINLFGQIVNSVPVSANSAVAINGGMASGIYLLQLKNENNIIASQKIIVQ